MSGKIAIIIPARYGSTRLPAKALIEVEGKPIIQYVWEKAKASKLANEVIIATDHEAILESCGKFGANAMMTSVEHKCGSDRIAEVAQKRPDIEYIINVQGDEPLITPESIDSCISALLTNEDADVSTLIRVIESEDELNNPNVVKCVKNLAGYAMYFSRSKIPYERNIENHEFYGHMGIYGYKRDALFKMTSLPQTILEKTESLEQLRVLDNGMKIITAVVKDNAVGIDTAEDVERFKSKLLA
jgi:3-deoxy-manno-octulosonate cytidylyltransferase (CMP-KDO synthetase)